MSIQKASRDFTGEIPHCAVLMAAYNGEYWISQQIDTILDQVSVEITLFISVDLSSDSTLDIVQRRSEKDERIKVLPYGERFGGAGRNFFRLIKDVSTEAFDLIAFADQDDIWLDNKLVTAWSRISSGICDVYSSDVTAFWEDGRTELIKKSYPQRKYDYLFEAAGPGCTYVFSAYAFSEVKRFVSENYLSCNEVTLHDWLLYAYCRQAKFLWFIDDEPLMLYRQHSSNQVGTNNNCKAYLKRLLKVKDKWYREQVATIAELVVLGAPGYCITRKFLLTNIRELRRRPRDQVVLFLLVLLGLF
ncbi:glycosyltransferase [Aliamphritea ceti]|uniref:glycosyltransferase n=1 Tax=Aliamphritea ceti TaxID=1524258 RepID=UPI0021C4369A|nr:glycosyltransferase [Aliamphritea ceti]